MSWGNGTGGQSEPVRNNFGITGLNKLPPKWGGAAAPGSPLSLAKQKSEYFCII
jgi:hypothetical protein